MAHVTEGRVRVGPLRAIPDVLEIFGVPLSPLLKQLGLPPDILSDAENTVTVKAAALLQ